MKIVFMGTPSYATTILKELLNDDEIDIGLILTQPDKPVGRKSILTPPDVKKFILENKIDIKIHQPQTLKDDFTINLIKEQKPDFIVVAAYGKILPKAVLDIATCINLHASILPEFRGASPIQSMILNSKKYIGVTSMLMFEGLDNGDILAFSCAKNLDYNCEEAFEILSNMAAKLCLKTLKEFDDISQIAQNNCLNSICGKIKKNDGLINFNENAFDIMAKFRAFNSWPGIFFENGLKLTKVEKALDMDCKPGVICEISDKNFVIGFKNSALVINEIQEVSKKPVSARDYINGKRLKIGDRIY